MARNGADVLVKKNSKLEAFLKKNLEDGTFDRVRAYDSCVVCSEKEDKAFKYVVLSDEWIYLTENPPKKIVEVVNLQHVTTVELVNDFPEFLSGEERENTQHIIVKYLTEVPLKSKKKAKNARQKSTKDKSTADAQSGADYGDSLSESMPSRLSSSFSKKKGAQLSPPPKRTHNLLLEKKMGNLKLAGSADEALLKTLLKKNETNQSSKHRSKFNLSSSSPSSQLHPLIGHSNQEVDFKDQLRSRKKRLGSSGNAPLRPLPQLQLPVASSESDFSTSSESSRESRSTTSNLASTLKNRYSSSKYDRIQELPRALPTPDTPDDLRRQEPSKLSYSQSGDLRLHLGDSEEENENDEEEVNHNKVSKKNANISGRQENHLGLPDLRDYL